MAFTFRTFKSENHTRLNKLPAAEPFAQFLVIRQNGRKSDGSHRESCRRSCNAERIFSRHARGRRAEMGSRDLHACPDHRLVGRDTGSSRLVDCIKANP